MWLKSFNLAKLFKVESDALGVGVGPVLTQEGRPIPYFNKKLSSAKRKFFTYDKDFYAIVMSLELNKGHEALKFIKG